MKGSGCGTKGSMGLALHGFRVLECAIECSIPVVLHQ